MKRIFIIFFSFALLLLPISRVLGDEGVAPTSASSSTTSSDFAIQTGQNDIVTATTTTSQIENATISDSVANPQNLEDATSTDTSTENSINSTSSVGSELSGGGLNLTSNSLPPSNLQTLEVEIDEASSTEIIPRSPEFKNGYLCGDIDKDSKVDRADIDSLIAYVFSGAPEPTSTIIDFNEDGASDVFDVITLIDYVYKDGEISGCKPNSSPVFTGISNAAGTLGEVYSFPLAIADPDGDVLNISYELPASSTYSTSTGIFTWEPLIAGTSTAKFIATDGKATSTYEIQLEAVKPAPKNGASYTCGDITQDNKFNANDISLYIEYIFSGGKPIEGTNYDLNNDGAPDVFDLILLIDFINADGPAPTCSIVESPNLPPNFSNFNPPTIATATKKYNYDVDAVDPEGKPLDFSLLENPAGMVISSTTGLIEWTPAVADATSTPYVVKIQVSDGVNSTSTAYSITVSTSTPPADNPPGNNPGGGNTSGNVGVPGGGGGSVTIGGGAATFSAPVPNVSPAQPPVFTDFNPPKNATATWLYYYTVKAANPGNNPLIFRLIDAPDGMQIFNYIGTITWIPTLWQVRANPYLVTVEVSNGKTKATASFEITVSNPPIIEVPLQLNTGENVNLRSEPSSTGEENKGVSTSTETITNNTSNNSQSGEPNPSTGLLAGLLAQFTGLKLALAIILLALLLSVFYFLFFKRRSKEKTEVENTAAVSLDAINAALDFNLEPEVNAPPSDVIILPETTPSQT
ncbi:MAG: dockerin type I domain-containing protein [Patescibacteria group bacterium]